MKIRRVFWIFRINFKIYVPPYIILMNLHKTGYLLNFYLLQGSHFSPSLRRLNIAKAFNPLFYLRCDLVYNTMCGTKAYTRTYTRTESIRETLWFSLLSHTANILNMYNCLGVTQHSNSLLYEILYSTRSVTGWHVSLPLSDTS